MRLSSLLRRVPPAVLILACLPGAAAESTQQTIDVKPGQLYLIFDPRLHGSGMQCELKLHRFTRYLENPVVKPEHSWEAIRESAESGYHNKGRIQVGTVLWEQNTQLFKMWYSAYTGDFITCYATSSDGLRWHKPGLELKEYRGSKANNIIAFGDQAGSVWRNPDGTNAQRRYVRWALQTREADDGHPADYAIYRFFSPDGKSWQRERKDPVLPGHPAKYLGGAAADGAIVYWLPGLQKHVCFYNISYPNPNPAPHDQPKNKHALRSIARFESEDGVRWNSESPSWAFMRDDQDAEWDPYIQFYGWTPLLHAVGDLYLGFTWLYHSNEGNFDIGFAYSTDTVTWRRPFRGQYVLPRGESGSWDGAMLMLSSSLIEKDGMWWMYYSGCPYLHRSSDEFPGEGKRYFAIGLARMPVGRVVSARSWKQQGTWTVGPVRWSGREMLLNAAIFDNLVVQVLDARDREIPGFRSSVLRGNGQRLPVAWPDGTRLADLEGREVRIRFHLNDAEIFGFQSR